VSKISAGLGIAAVLSLAGCGSGATTSRSTSTSSSGSVAPAPADAVTASNVPMIDTSWRGNRRRRRSASGFIGSADGSFPPEDFATALEESLTPGKHVLRYDRLWRLARHETDSKWIFGRLGFEYPEATELGLWDDLTKDYRSIQPGQLVRYAIDVQARRVAFGASATPERA
jgi:hypothetical protein